MPHWLRTAVPQYKMHHIMLNMRQRKGKGTCEHSDACTHPINSTRAPAHCMKPFTLSNLVWKGPHKHTNSWYFNSIKLRMKIHNPIAFLKIFDKFYFLEFPLQKFHQQNLLNIQTQSQRYSYLMSKEIVRMKSIFSPNTILDVLKQIKNFLKKTDLESNKTCSGMDKRDGKQIIY